MPRAVLITGVATGIGRGLSRSFSEAGWRTYGIDVLSAGRKYCDTFFHVSVTDPMELGRLAASLKLKSLDSIVNNAAIQVEKALFDTTDKEWSSVIDTNLSSVFYVSRAFASRLRRPASIINVSSIHARATSKGMASYVASKGGVSALSRAMALELAEEGIRVNAILPGAIETEMLQRGLARSGDAKRANRRLLAATPLGKIGSPADIANLALFLADSSKSGNITGQEFVSDGGVLARLASE